MLATYKKINDLTDNTTVRAGQQTSADIMFESDDRDGKFSMTRGFGDDTPAAVWTR